MRVPPVPPSVFLRKAPLLTLSSVIPLLLAACGMQSGPTATSSASSSLFTVTGTVHGGQQPIVGAQISLYAAGKAATASAARSMLAAPVPTGPGGSFSLTGLYTCQPGDQVYLVATGGDSGSGPNSAISLMAALGPCASLQTKPFVAVNEVTTVGSIYPLAPFMSGPQNLGSAPVDANTLAGAFANVTGLISASSGAALQTSLGNAIVPQATINSLANSVAACINSTQGSQSCASLFSDTTVSGSTPANTLQAVLNLAQNPTLNPGAIYTLALPSAPFQPTLTGAPSSWAIAATHPNDVLLYHNDLARTGVQTDETQLTPTNVTPATFGKLYSFPVDSYLFANPLFAGGVGQLHNLVLTASTRGTVTAFDADNNNPAAGYLWQQSLIPASERYVTQDDYNCTNPPEAGIVGTPVIDRQSQTIYVLVKSISTSTSTFYQRLHAISLLDGTERPNSPVLINPTFTTNGQGDGASGTSLPFNAQRQLNRSALLLTPNDSGGKTVWIDFASHCDIGPYHGIVLGYNSSNISQLTSAFNNTPNGSDGGIWMGAGGLSSDTQGYLYALSGNGTFDANTGGPDYGDAALKLAPPAVNASSNLMSVADYFTPSNQADLQSKDLDLGGAEGILFNDPASGTAPNLLIASDKNGYVYLLNTANMGQYDTGTHGINSQNGDIQDWQAGGVIIYNFAFFNNTLYTSTPLSAFAFHPGTSSTAGSFNTTPTASTSLNNLAPTLSVDGTQNALVWAFDQNAILHAFTPNLTEVYNSSQAANQRDAPAPFVKFNSPVIANGKVFLAGQGALTVYGLLP
jgi:hypothetical protein